MKPRSGFSVELPDELDEPYDAYERQCKGHLEAIAVIAGTRYKVSFYDPTRLAQTLESELEACPLFFERNLIVIPSVTRAHIEAAIELLARTGRQVDLVPEEAEPRQVERTLDS